MDLGSVGPFQFGNLVRIDMPLTLGAGRLRRLAAEAAQQLDIWWNAGAWKPGKGAEGFGEGLRWLRVEWVLFFWVQFESYWHGAVVG